jgi:hypothetical protein
VRGGGSGRAADDPGRTTTPSAASTTRASRAGVWAYTRPLPRHRRPLGALFPLLAAVDSVQPYLVKVAIDAPTSSAATGRVLTRIVGLFFPDPGGPVLRSATRKIYFATWTGQRVVHDLRAALFAHVPAAARRLLRPESGRARDDADPRGRGGDRRGVSRPGVRGDPGRRPSTLGGVVAVMLVLHLRLTLNHVRRAAAASSWSPWPSGAGPARLPGRARPPGAPERRAPGDDLGHGGHPAVRRETARGGELRELSERTRQAQFRRGRAGDDALCRRPECVSAPSWWRPFSGGAGSRSSRAR